MPALLTGLDPILVAARRKGLIGPGPLAPHVEHALGFVDAMGTGFGPAQAEDPSLTGVDPISGHLRLLDLGSGAGLPGLVLALHWEFVAVALLDASDRRTAFLRDAVEQLGLCSRVEVIRRRAEDGAREPAWRQCFDVVTARSFGPPAVTAECGAPFLRVGGLLVVSEPPPGSEEGRWPPDELARLGLLARRPHRGRYSFQVLQKVAPSDDRHPRRSGVPAKRPLF
ncbi:MAG: 16S rRNA (guanine(527)-N(7))-methyltransferase RsmG [Acidimicrobiales bacterium]